MIQLKNEDGIATLTLARPPVNAINNEWLDRFNDILDQLSGTDNWSVLHIRSTEKVFCAGADLTQIRSRFEVDSTGELMMADIERFHALFDRIERLPQVTLAEINGPALGGGFELTLACDLRIAAMEAQIGLPEARIGLIPGAGGTQRLTRLCGSGISSRLILTGEIVDGRTAHELAMVQWAVPRAKLAEEARAIAVNITKLSPAALAASKSCIAAASDARRNGFREELEATRALFLNADTRQRVQAFLTRKPADKPKKPAA